MAGKYQFSGNGTGKVLNQGSISAPGGYVALLGANVSNEGTIQARLGSVALAAGRAITLDVAGDGLLNVAVNAGAVGALVNNGGMIKADGGSVVLTAQAAGDLLRTVVNNTGVIEAQTIDTRGGTIKLLGDMQTGTVNAGGTLDASAPDGGKGGFIETSAAHVKFDDALKVTTASSHGLTGTWLIDPTDYTIAATGGDQTGAFFTNALKSTSVQIQSISGGSGVLGDINVNDTISWSANQLKLTAQNNININQPLRGSGTASLALEYGQANVASGNTSKYNVKAEIDLPSGLNFSTKLGSDTVTATTYTVINSLGVATSTSGTDLQGLKNALSGKFVLGANIDATVTSTWNGGLGFTSIGTTSVPFTGQFDGLGHVITGLNSSTTSAAGAAGLFGSNTGSIRNIGLVAPVIAANIASTQGNAAALVAINSGTISNAYVSGGSVTVTTGAIGAGLVGLNSGTISDSYNSSKVSVVGNYDFWMGGLVGNTTKTSTIINSYNAGEVVGAYTAGGLVGNNLGAITNSFNSGNVSGTTNTGGLTSHNRGTGVITNSFNTGAVTSNSLTGGLVGSNVASGQILNSYSTGAVSSRSTTATGIGGLAGGNSGIIRNSYATGAVTGVTAVGGLIGANTSAGLTENAYSSGAVSLLSGGTGTLGGLIGSIAAGTNPSITGGYYNNTVNSGMPGVGTNGGGTTPAITGLTSTQMQTASNFSAFTFTTVGGATGNNWVMVDTDGTLNNSSGALGATGPMLAAEYSTNIYSSHQLQLMAMNLAGNYTLRQDVNVAATGLLTDVWNSNNFIPVGTSTATPFTGTLDGAGHVVSGLVINRPGTNFAGLIGATSSTAIVRNIGLEGGSITGKNGTGALIGSNLGTVSGSFSTASVSGATQVGGLVGANGVGSTITNSYASGAVTGTGTIGGLVGLNTGSLINNYASGAITGGSVSGGLAGSNSGTGTTTGNFWDTTTSGQATSATGTGLSSAQMKLLSTYSGAAWDLAGAWIVYDTYTYPLLRAFMTPLQVTFASNTSKTYDGTATWAAPVYTYSNPNVSLAGSLNYGAAGTAVNAGSYAITTGGLYSGQHGYAISANDATLTINKRAATLTGALVQDRTYDGTTSANILGGILSGILTVDKGKVTANVGSFDTSNAGTGKTVTVIGGGTAGGNYAITGGGAGLTGTITPKALTLSGLAATTRQYNGSTAATLTGGSLTGLIGSETLNLGATSGVFDGKNAGTQAVTVTLGALSNGSGLASNYTLDAPTSVTGTITAKTLTWNNLAVDNKEYDGNTTAAINKGSITGLVSGETLTAGPTAAFADKNAGNGKTVTVSTLLGNGGGGGLASNYTLADTSVMANITQKALTVSGMTAGTRAYDGTTAATLAGGSLTGLVTGETLVVSGGSGAFGDKNAGNGKAVTVSGVSLADGTGLASNYTVSNPTDVTGSITQKALSVTGALAADKTYDGALDATITGGSLSGFVGSETVGLASLAGAFADKNAGSGKAVSITGGTLSNGSNGGLASNYSVDPVSGLTAGIAQKALSVTGVAAANKVYDGTTKASVTGGSLSGLVGGETLGLYGLSGAFGDKNAGTGKAITVSGATLADGTGLASNYTISNPTGVTANVTQATISSVTNVVADSKVYDGGTAVTFLAATATFNGMVSGDSLAIGATKAAFSDKNAGAGKGVTISFLTLGGLDAANYTLASSAATGTGTITPKALTIAGMSAVNKAYDGSTKATLSGGSISGLVGLETLGVTGLSATFDTRDAGTGKTVTATGSTLANGGNGGLAANYTISNPTGLIANITPKALTVSGMTAGTRDYDGTTAATLAGGSLTGLVPGETLVVSGGSGAFGDKNAGNGKAVTVSGVSLADGTGLASNYTVSNPTDVTGSITQKALSVTGALAADKTYDGAEGATITGGSLSGFVGSETVGLASLAGAFADKNAGSGKAVSITGGTLSNGSNGGLASNYSVGPVSGLSASIAQKALSVTGVAAANKGYDGTTKASVTGGSLSGLVGNETLGLSGLSGAFGDKNAGTGKAITVSGATLADGTGLASNYTVSNPTDVTATISKANIGGVSNIVAGSKVYDATDTATVSNAGATFAGMVNGDSLNVSATSANFIDKNAGSGKVVNASGMTLGGTDAGNYNLTAITGTGAGSITQALITGVTGIAAAGKTYDGTDTATVSNAGATFAGMFNGDSLNVSATSANFIDKNAGSGKVVNASGLTLGGTDAGNYNLTAITGTGTGTITQAQIASVSGITAAGKTYDGTDAAILNAGATYNGMFGGDSLTFTATKAAFSDKNAGTGKTVNVSGIALGGADAGNYTLASNTASGTGNIAKAAITGVSGFAAGTRVYDATTTATVSNAGATFAGMVNGDSLNISATSATFIDKNAGSGKVVNASGMTLGGTDAGNYNLTAITGKGTGSISQAQIASVSGITAAGKTYDGTDAAILNAGATYNGMFGGDSLTFTATKAAFSDKNAGTGKTVNVSGIALGGADAGNYTLASNTASGTGDIAKATITGVSGFAAGTRVYDATTTATVSNAGATFAGMLNGDSLNISATSATFIDKNAGSGKVVNASGMTLGGTDAGNYNLTAITGTGTGTITQAQIASVTGITAAGKTYDGTDAAILNAGATYNGMFGGDSLTFTVTKAAFSDKNAGNGKTVNVSGIALGGADAGNYTLASNTASGTGDIAKAAITGVSGFAAGTRVYDATTTATVSNAGATFAGMLNGDSLNISATSATFIDKNAGSGKVVNASGMTLGGTDAGNYNLTAITGTGTGTITQALITGVSGITAAGKTYDGTDAAILNAGATYNGMFGGDSLTFTATKAAFSDKNAGNGKTVNVSGIALDGADAGNYILASNTASGTGAITPKALTVTGVTAGNKVYDGTLAAGLTGGALNGLVSGETLSLSGLTGTFATQNAASNIAVTARGAQLADGTGLASNYTVSNPTGVTANITPKALTIGGIAAGNKVYDGTLAASLTGGALQGLVGDETLVLSGTTGVFGDKNAGSNKTVTVSGASLADGTGRASNYTVSNPTGLTASITAKALTVAGQLAGNKVYDGNTVASLSGGALSGLVAGETLGFGGQSAVFSDKNAANGKAVTVTGTSLVDTITGLASNYTVSNPTGLTASIMAKALTVSGQLAGNKVYDGNAQASLSGGALSGLVAGESLGFGGQSAAFSDKNAANGKAVTVTGTSLVDTITGQASNYTVSNPTGLTASITPKALTVAGQLAGNKVYDGNTAVQLSGGALSGLVAGESLGLAGQTATFADKNAGTAKAVTVSGTTLLDTASGLASNYTVSNPTGLTASITAKALTVSGQLAGNKVYDGNAEASLSGGVLRGLVAGETLVIGGQSATFADKNAANGKAVTVTGTSLVDTASGLASNYTVSNPTGLTASITPKALTVAGQLAGNKVYDGNTAAQLSGGVLAGLVAGETLGLAGQTATFADKNAANGKAVTVTGTSLVDTITGLASNYTVSNPTGLTASITPASLLVRATGAASRVYDTTTNASVTLADNRIAGDVLTISNSGASFADKNAGTNKTVTLNGIALSGTDAGNYTVNATATTTASITQAALGVKVDNAEKDQGLANPAFTASYTGLLGNDTLANEVGGNLAFSTSATIATPSGSYLVSAAGQTSTNYALTYTPGVLTVKPTEARQSAVASVIAAVNVAPSQGNMVQAEVVAKGETVTSKEDVVQVVAERGQPRQGSTPVVLTTASVNSNVLPGLRLSVVDTGLRLPVAAGNTSIESQ
ncbi:YDG domain-containing protein [Janthinobacterium sp. PSPC2-1]|uniref:YDG domain-containing protein n=1 Tax=unclassified Janthinobacterium TaxID=2610881 RepID=UPI003CE6BB33